MRGFVTVLGLLVGLAWSGVTEGRTEATVRYSKAQVYSAALRYLRVDLGYPVTEKDSEAAYLLFEHPSQGRGEAAVRGAIELVQTDVGIRLFVSVPRLPVYQEDVFKRGLLKKLQEEYGSVSPSSPSKKGKETPKKKPSPEARGE